ncbi:MAG: N-acetylglucosamine-6-sulfatase [Thermoleophilaceae bacterium]|nr:N-acetylglucosamine-6-sulfatase [Thermoleophilaceae bacterium]
MGRFQLGASFALVALVAAAFAVWESAADGRDASAAAVPQSRPNVVVLMTDDQTVEDMDVMPRTRALLGAQGVTFAHNYVSYPVCCPSRATFFSGQYAHNHHVMGLYPPTGGYIRFDRWNSLPVWLQRAGYTTAHIGKYMNGYGTQVQADVPPGWSEWHGAIDGSTYRMWGYTLDDNGHRHTYGSPFVEDPRLYQTDVYRHKAVDFIRRRAPSKRPFFLSVAFLAPHHEMKPIRDVTGKLVRPAPRYASALRDESLDTTRAFDERNVTDKPAFLRRGPLSVSVMDRIAEHFRQRQRTLLSVDDAVVAIVKALRESGELDNTYIVFTSDNGYMQGEHDVPSGKMLPYDPSTQVPLIVRGPGIPHGRVSKELVGNVDLSPTILQAARAPAGLTQDGRSLLPFARHPDWRTRRAFLHETGGERYVPVRDQDQDGEPAVRRILSYRAVRTNRWLYVEYRAGGRELYDLSRDPNELHSHAYEPGYAPVGRVLHRLLMRLEHCTGADCRRWAPPAAEHGPPVRRPGVRVG